MYKISPSYSQPNKPLVALFKYYILRVWVFSSNISNTMSPSYKISSEL